VHAEPLGLHGAQVGNLSINVLTYLLPEILRSSLRSSTVSYSCFIYNSTLAGCLSVAKSQLLDAMLSAFGMTLWKTSRLLTWIVCIIVPHWKHSWPLGEDCTF